MSFGPNPWQQAHWDWRAAGNFIFGGAGGGLLVLSAFLSPASRWAIVLAGLASVGAGLFCVWLEIGRPLRALHVMFHPQRSWMTREAFVAALVFPCGLAVLAGVDALSELLALLALAFLFCQGRILVAARGIPAWRQPMMGPLVMATGFAEGAGLLLAASPLLGPGVGWLPLVLTVLLLARLVVWHLYRRQLGDACAPAARRVLDQIGGVLQYAGTLLPLLLLAPLAAHALPPGLSAAVGVLAGLVAAATGAWMKFSLVTRAAYNQGFALTRLPVRGTRS